MGTWSATIMGGDTPLDIESEIYKICEVEMFPEELEDGDEPKNDIPKEVLAKKWHEIYEQIIDIDEDAPMVLAVVMMRVGAYMTKQMKSFAVKAAKNDDWANNDAERKSHIDNFIEIVKNYDGETPTHIAEEGLFGKLFS